VCGAEEEKAEEEEGAWASQHALVGMRTHIVVCGHIVTFSRYEGTFIVVGHIK
jgi:hypothetical protein